MANMYIEDSQPVSSIRNARAMQEIQRVTNAPYSMSLFMHGT